MNKKKRWVLCFLVTLFLLSVLSGCIKRDASSYSGPAAFKDGIWHGLFFSKLPESYPSTSGYTVGVSLGYIWSVLCCIGGFAYGLQTERNPLSSLIAGYLGGLINAAMIYGLVALIIWIF